MARPSRSPLASSLTALAWLAAVALVLAAPLTASALAATDPLPGTWKGTISIPTGPLEVILDLSRDAGGAAAGTISIPAQGARDLPLANVALEGTAFRASIAGIPGDPTFTGTLDAAAGTIAGNFTQGGGAFPFTLARGDDKQATAAKALEGLRAEVEAALASFEVPGLALAIVHGDEIVALEGYGTKRIGEDAPVTADTLFAIGSSTKAFTTAVLGTLVDEGKLQWSDRVVQHLPEFRLVDDHATLHITVRDLVTHLSGMPRHDLSWYNADISRAEAVRRLAHLPPNRDLREAWQYQNGMFVTAGVLIERVTGQSWEDAVRTRLFAPLGMTGANFSVADSQRAPDFAYPHERRDKALRVVPFRDISMVGPAGSINASARDMAQWLRLHLGDGAIGGRRILQDSTVRELHTPVAVAGGYPVDPHVILQTYAPGWFVDSYRGHYRVHHGGAIDGFLAHVGFLPVEGYGVAAFANRGGTALPELVARVVLDRLLGLEPAGWLTKGAAEYAQAKEMSSEAEAKQTETRVAGTKPSRPLAAFAGSYEHPGYGTITVKADKGALTLEYNRIVTPLEHWHYDVFAGAKGGEDDTFAGTLFSFRTALDGRVESLVAPFELLLEPTVFQRGPDPRLRDADYLARFTGNYALGPQTVEIALRGAVLVASLPGQPPYELVPEENDTFALKNLTGFRVAFESDAKGEVTGARFLQPNGVFEAAKMK